MKNLKPKECPITRDKESKLIWTYYTPPSAETNFSRPNDEAYLREVWQFIPSQHLISTHSMQVATDYSGEYVEATYKNLEGLTATFDRITSLPPEKSDNTGRFLAVKSFAESWFRPNKVPSLLDVGSGLGVFPYAVRKAGWQCTAIDPDARAINNLRERVSVNTIHGNFMNLNPSKIFDIVTLNKVLEHVIDPIAMLSRVNKWLAKDGFVYLELPDGEVASKYGPEREEFTIDHLHIFSMTSATILASRAGFTVKTIYRLQEPSSKYTIRAILTK